jgi:hypothetical protein
MRLRLPAKASREDPGCSFGRIPDDNVFTAEGWNTTSFKYTVPLEGYVESIV